MSTKLVSKVFVNEDSLNDESNPDGEDVDDDEDEEETRVNSNGSVLMPSDSPYDKFIKIKEANTDLYSTIITKPRSPCRVQFNPSIVTHSIEFNDCSEEGVLTEIEEDPRGLDEVEVHTSTDSSSSDSSSTVICKTSKLLLVTVPTAFTEQLDEDFSNDLDADQEDEISVVEIEDVTEISDVYFEADNTTQQNETSVENDEDEVEEEPIKFEVHETEMSLEDEIDELTVSPSTGKNLHKPVLTKDARIEEDSESEAEPSNSIEDNPRNLYKYCSQSIDDLTENFREFNISTQVELENLNNSANFHCEETFNPQINQDEVVKTDCSVEPEIEIKKGKNNKKLNKRKTLNSSRTESLNSSVRNQCPIYQRNYGVQSNKRDLRSKSVEIRPQTAPTRRHCCNYWDQGKLPGYNGLRSEYGLTAEQLMQRKRDKKELVKTNRTEKEQKYLDEIRKQKENDQIFHSWLVKKKKEAAQKFSRKRLQSTYQFKNLVAPTKHLDKVGALRRKLLKRENTSYSLEEFFKNANPHEQKTYRIYLGLCVE